MPTNVFELDSYLCRRKVVALTGKIHVYDERENLVAFTKQKAFKLREDIRIFADEAEQEPLLSINARQIIDIGATYDVRTADGASLGALRRKALASIVKDQWKILADGDAEIGSVDEDSTGKALARRFIPLMNIFLTQNYTVVANGAGVAGFARNMNPFVSKLQVSLVPGQVALDRRLVLATAVLLLLIEGKQN